MSIKLGLLASSQKQASPLLLDVYTSAAAAYSLRKLRTAYTGAAIQVRRSNDGALLDIGFLNNVLDTATLSTFVGANSGAVVKWYDQSGNANNAFVANVNTVYPRIINAGVLQTQNGLPSINFNTIPLLFTNNINPDFNLSIYLVGKSDTTTNGPMLGQSGSGPIAGQLNAFYTMQVGNPTQMYGYQTTAGTGNINFNVVNYFYTAVNTANIFRNNTAIPITNNYMFISAQTFEQIGNYAGAFFTVGFMSEVIIYKSNQLTNNTGINTNINSFYTIY